MNKYIVRKNNEFSVEEHERLPINGVLYHPAGYNPPPQKFYLTDNEVEFIWGIWEFKVLYKNKKLFSYITQNATQVCDFMNKYNAMSKQEIDELYKESQEQTKTELEEAIEKLKEEKELLEEQIDIYRKIKKKQEELNELLAQLENDKE